LPHKRSSLAQIKFVDSFHKLASTLFEDENNALCWQRTLVGDFEEIVNKIDRKKNINIVTEKMLLDLTLTKEGEKARSVLLDDMKLLSDNGSAPTLNIITHYDKDEELDFISTDVYSYHVDRSPIPSDTYLCTYYGDASDILPNNQAIQKILIPEVSVKLRAMYDGPEEEFDNFLEENFFDLHYEALPGANPINLGNGHLWRLSTDHPGQKVPPCIHRAPIETSGKPRLLMIC
jgi:hypothetical protein